MSTVGKVLLGIVLFIVMIFAINQFEIFGIKFWGTQRENARREVFEQTQSYVEGKRQELVKAHHEWVMADSDSKILFDRVSQTLTVQKSKTRKCIRF